MFSPARSGHPLFSILLVCLASFLAAQFPYAGAARAEHPQEEYKRIQKDIKLHKQKLETVKKKELSVLEELRKTTTELNEIERQLSAQRDKIKRLNSNILAVQEDIKSDSAILQGHKARLKKRLRTLLMFTSNKDALLALLSGEDTAQTIRLEKYLSDISNYDYGLIKKYRSELQAMAEKESGLRKLFADLKAEEKGLSKLEGSLKDKKKERESLLANVRKEKGVFENMIKEMKDSSNRLLAIIKETERQEREARKKRGPKTRPGTKEEEPADDSGFGRLKGKLSWPVAGKVVYQYGTQVDPIFNLPVFRSGIHVKTENGAPVKAVHEGRVVFADNFKGYGQLVIVSHGGGYHSLYGNLAKIFSKNGAIINEQQIIGEAGESSTLGTSGLYFEIRYKGKPLDPQQWLRK
ncbi:MAG: peptidoglycan DD-metalloendopeptidase family protein [Nitrospirae bacterium]|nr:peptidoglycan DD-metalloendopeptidase family protein [Nitrospirota bacterium]